MRRATVKRTAIGSSHERLGAGLNVSYSSYISKDLSYLAFITWYAAGVKV